MTCDEHEEWKSEIGVATTMDDKYRSNVSMGKMCRRSEPRCFAPLV